MRLMGKLESTFLTLSPRRIGWFVALLGIAMAAGHLAQTIAARNPAKLAQASPKEPTHIVMLSAGPSESGLTAPLLRPKADPGDPAAPNLTRLAKPTPAEAEPQAAVRADCAREVSVTPAPGAMAAIAVAAPCDGGARIVLRHAGLSLTERLPADGKGLIIMPAMAEKARFEIRFDDGRTTSATLEMPEMAGVRRFAVQWSGAGEFVLHGMENGAEFGQPGDVSPSRPGTVTADRGPGGWLSVLGDASVQNPQLAQVYTYPAEAAADIVVEAPVTAATCGRKLNGQTLISEGGAAQSTNLTLAMPDCSAVGDFLVLKNLAQDTKLAAK